MLFTNDYNSRMYFDRYVDHYLTRAHPHKQAGAILRGFAESDGSYGNAFTIYNPHGWDNRAVGMEGGSPRWFNAVASPAHVQEYVRRALERNDDLRLNPDLDLLFFYSKDSPDSLPVLQELFPQGRPFKHEQENQSKTFFSYRVPALGLDRLLEVLEFSA